VPGGLAISSSGRQSISQRVHGFRNIEKQPLVTPIRCCLGSIRNLYRNDTRHDADEGTLKNNWDHQSPFIYPHSSGRSNSHRADVVRDLITPSLGSVRVMIRRVLTTFPAGPQRRLHYLGKPTSLLRTTFHTQPDGPHDAGLWLVS